MFNLEKKIKEAREFGRIEQRLMDGFDLKECDFEGSDTEGMYFFAIDQDNNGLELKLDEGTVYGRPAYSEDWAIWDDL